MILPSIENEKKLNKTNVVFGVDEAGRGPLAGPVVAAAAWVNPEFLNKDFEYRSFVRDSKTVSEKRREELYDFFLKNENFEFVTEEVGPKVIDDINILNSSLLAMRVATEKLQENVCFVGKKKEAVVLVDGNRRIPKLKSRQVLFVKGDRDVFSIAVASICAKVFRDRLMRNAHEKFPVYGFNRHKGYGTKLHMEALRKYGPCDIHRKSFSPVSICQK